MFGVLVNAFAVFICSGIGLLFRKGLKQNYQDIIMQAIPLVVMFVGISTATKGLLDPNSNPLLFIIGMTLGSVIGEFLRIDDRLNGLGNFLQAKLSKSESKLADGFVTATLIFCIGTLAILGPMESTLKGDNSLLYIKSCIDGITSIILVSTYGIGVMLSGFSILIYQGAVAILASFIEPIITDKSILEISILGGVMVFAISLNMLQIKKIRLANMIPAILIPIIYYSPLVQKLIENIKVIF